MPDIHSLFIPAVREVLRYAAITQDRVTENREPPCKQTLWDRLVAHWEALTLAGCPPALLRGQALVTPECGLAGRSPAEAAAALDLTHRLGARVAAAAAGSGP